ncbi:uncharacterized protein LOC100202392 isoform X2 [Hydra vulgaris]|uniref:Uncharacterized protein LOC100202392 isoform X2 n=1 Tax=Hydra vulgaris TaxID=6087 RepID=A0ABM4DEJ0_HYDVU
MDIGVEVLVPLTVLLTILILLVIGVVCRFYIWHKIFQKKPKYQYVNPSTTKAPGYPKLPSFKAGAQTVQAVQILNKQQYTKYYDINGNRKDKIPLPPDSKGKSNGYEKVFQGDSQESVFLESDELSSNQSEDSMILNSDPNWPGCATQLLQRKQLDNGDINYYESKLLSSKQKFKSEPIIYNNVYENKTDDPKHRQVNQTGQKNVTVPNPEKKIRRSSDSRSRQRRCSAQTLMNICDGEIDFIIFYQAEKRLLNVTVKSLKYVNLNAYDFIGVLNKYNRNDKNRPEGKPHLIQNNDGKIVLNDSENLSYMVYVTLSPNNFYKNHTNLTFGKNEVLFNETFAISAVSAEHIGFYDIVFHALCSLANGEPMVFGEGYATLKDYKWFQNTLQSVKLTPPKEEFELLQNPTDVQTDLGFLSLVLNYNLIAHKLIVKILQATGLPKIGVTGHPNTSVKTSLYIGKQRHSKHNTSILKRQREPTFNSTIEFGLSKEKLLETDIIFEIRHHGPMYRKNIGYVIVGSSAQAEGAVHWQNMLEFQCFEKMHKILPYKPDGFTP